MTGYSSSSPKNILQQRLHETTREAGDPPDELERISYGVITEVDYETSQVKVRKFLEGGRMGDMVSDGFLPLATPLSEIHLLWGLLREGLVVRVYWRGKLAPKNVLIEVIGDEDHKLLRKAPESNEVQVGPWRLFNGPTILSM
jgi:hypothetical protein